MPYLTIATNDVLTAAQMNANWRDQVVTQCTNATRPTGVDGMVISVTDLDTIEVYNGSAWVVLVNYGGWTSYTPTLTATTTNPTLGTASTISGRYQRVGRLINFRAKVQWGSSGNSFGTGAYVLSLPVAADTTLDEPIGIIRCEDLGGTSYLGWINTDGSMQTHSTSANVGPTTPFTWGNSDVLKVHGWYEAAS